MLEMKAFKQNTQGSEVWLVEITAKITSRQSQRCVCVCGKLSYYY